VRLYFPHGHAIVDPFTASWALMKLQPWNRVCLAMKLAGPLPPNLLNLIAAAGGTLRDAQHRTPLRGPSWKR